MYDIEKVRADFPILSRQVYNRPLVYLDNGATTQKPRCVVDSMVEEYYNVNANVHRGVHFLSQQATELHEQSRETVRKFINARSTSEIVFTRGTTESINLVATCMGNSLSPTLPRKGGSLAPEVIISTVEHHSNLVPWQMMCERLGGQLRVIPMSDEGVLDLEAYKTLFNEHTVMVAVAQVSNVLGTVNPVKEIIQIAHEHGLPVLVDGAQSTPHFKVDVQELDCDFFAFSGHKIYGPTGVGVLYGKEEWLDRLPPYMGGGEMIKNVTFEKTTYNELPFKFEAGTPDYIATTGLAKALDYVSALGMDNIFAHEQDLTNYAIEQMSLIPGMKIYGQKTPQPLHFETSQKLGGDNYKSGMTADVTNSPLRGVGGPHDAVISFQVGDIHHLDLGTLLDRLGVAVRTGHHCAEPLMHRLGILGTARASFGLYNTREEVDTLCNAIDRVRKMF